VTRPAETQACRELSGASRKKQNSEK
jgi:hypothetical protein